MTDALSLEEQDERQRSLAVIRRRNERERRLRQRENSNISERTKIYRDVQIPDVITVQDLANRMAEPSSKVIRALLLMGHPSTLNSPLDGDTAELIAREFSHRPIRVSASDVEIGLGDQQDTPETLKPRAPVVTVMGHVDHGKTSLLDKIRETNIAESEAGSITQHIGASHVQTPNGDITFIDTPGHAAFSLMRARGAKATDIVILVIAANDGLMPQTEEAIDHARAFGVPIIVAINKTDLENANPDRVRDGLLHKEVIVEKRGGDTLDVEISAKTGKGVSELLEAVLLQSGMMELRANPDCPAEGIVLEARLDMGRGAIATVLVTRGKLRKGDIFVVGSQRGRARTLRNEYDQTIYEAGPSVAVEIDGLYGIPDAGDKLVVVESDTRARGIMEYREKIERDRKLSQTLRTNDLDNLLTQAKAERTSGLMPGKLQIVIKADVRGSAEAIVQALKKIGNDKISIEVLSHGVGAITETDVNLAAGTNAHIFGFNVRANAKAKEQARNYNVTFSFHSIIYELLDHATRLATGLLPPEVQETVLGEAKILEVFQIGKVGAIAGAQVTEGVAQKNAKARLMRNGTVIYTGNVVTLKRFKKDVPEVGSGTECGIGLQSHQDLRPDDTIEFFVMKEIERKL